MKNILLLDTSIASSNKGDDIIMECVRQELGYILNHNFELTLPTHVSSFHWYQVLRNSSAINRYADCDLKFVGGTNLLIPQLLTHYPQWNINLFNYQPLKGCILVGVGAGGGAENRISKYSKYIYSHMLNKKYSHSVRDERTKIYLERLGIPAINTGCVTMWALTPEFCKTIPQEKSDTVVFTLTASSKIDQNDQYLINTLINNYSKVFFWPQGIDDLNYFQQFKNIETISIIQANKKAYNEFLTNTDTDYIGTRLHGGVYAMRHKRRAIIIAIDERARAINERNHINCIEKSDISSLKDLINNKFETKVIMPFEEIAKWKSQFQTNN